MCRLGVLPSLSLRLQPPLSPPRQLADFGLSRMVGNQQTHVVTENYGTATHAAPERISDGKLTFSSDIYSFGCIM